MKSRNSFESSKSIKRFKPLLTPMARKTSTSERKFHPASSPIVVKKNLPSAQLLGHSHLAGPICRPATGHKTEIRAICNRNSFIFVLEGDDDLYRPKNFILS